MNHSEEQQGLFGNALFSSIARPVNVASVPQRSPFRYPGGKTWLIPQVREWLKSLNKKPEEFVEPFAGGGIVSLTVAAEDLAEHMTMVELDEQVAAVWHTIINNDEGNWLAEQIMSFDISSLTPDDVRKMTETNGSVRTEKGLRRGGIQRL